MSLTTFTIQGNDFLAYASIPEADAYLVADPIRGPAWAVLTADIKARHLVSATRRIDLEIFPGRKTDPNQETEWPRTGVSCDGIAISPTEIPGPVEKATIIVAGSVPADSTATASGSPASNIESVKAGPLEVRFFNPSDATRVNLLVQNPDAFAILRCLIGSGTSASPIGVGKVSGSGKQSTAFYGGPSLNRGY